MPPSVTIGRPASCGRSGTFTFPSRTFTPSAAGQIRLFGLLVGRLHAGPLDERRRSHARPAAGFRPVARGPSGGAPHGPQILTNVNRRNASNNELVTNFRPT